MSRKNLVLAIGGGAILTLSIVGGIGLDRGYKSAVESQAPARVYYTNADTIKNSSLEYDDLVVGRENGSIDIYLRNEAGKYDEISALRESEISFAEKTRDSGLTENKKWYNEELKKVREGYSKLRKELDEIK